MLEQRLSAFPHLVGHQVMLLTTFRKDGRRVPTPVWFVEDAGRLYVYTRPESGKVKRVRSNGRAALAPCDARGNVLGPERAGHARLLPAEAAPAARALFVRKYGVQFRLFDWAGRLQRATPAYIEVTPGAE